MFLVPVPLDTGLKISALYIFVAFTRVQRFKKTSEMTCKFWKTSTQNQGRGQPWYQTPSARGRNTLSLAKFQVSASLALVGWLIEPR